MDDKPIRDAIDRDRRAQEDRIRAEVRVWVVISVVAISVTGALAAHAYYDLGDSMGLIALALIGLQFVAILFLGDWVADKVVRWVRGPRDR